MAAPRTSDSAAPIGVWIGNLLGLIVTIALVWAAWGIGTSPRLNILLLIGGGLTGWVCGILITPLTKGEKTKFSEYGKALATVATGYGVAKLDKVFELSVREAGDISEVLIGRIAMFASAFALGALFTFVWRQYVSKKR